MKTANQKRGIRIVLTIPPNMYSRLENSANIMGVSVLDYIRYVIMNESKEEDRARSVFGKNDNNS